MIYRVVSSVAVQHASRNQEGEVGLIPPTINPSGLLSDFVIPVPTALCSVVSEDLALIVGEGGENFRQAYHRV